MLGRAEPVRLLLCELQQAWAEPWAEAGLQSVAECLQQLERMRAQLPQPVFGLPILEHRLHECVTEGKTERRAVADGGSFFLAQTPVIAHYIASVCKGGELLPKGGVREGHRACQLAEDVEDALAEAYAAWGNLLQKANAPAEVVKGGAEATRRWWVETRLPRWAAHFDRAVRAGGGQHLIANSLSYGQHGKHHAASVCTVAAAPLTAACLLAVDVLLFFFCDAVAHELPDRWKSLQAPALLAFSEQMAKRPAIAQRLHTRAEKYKGMAPGF